MIRLAEGLSFRTCEECGSPGRKTDTSWIRTLCNHCRQKIAKAKAERWLATEERQVPAGGFPELGASQICDICGIIRDNLVNNKCEDC